MKENYYVYALIDLTKKGNYDYDGLKFEYEPFYIGKGKGRRMIRHFESVDKYFTEDGKIKFMKVVRKKENKEKLQLCKKLLDLGYEKDTIAIKLVGNLAEDIALKIEKEYIDKIGRLFFESGPLTNIADGGIGGTTLSPEMRKQRSIDYSGTRHPLSRFKYRFINSKGEIFEPESNMEFCRDIATDVNHLVISARITKKKTNIITLCGWTIEKQLKEKEFTQKEYIITRQKFTYTILNEFNEILVLDDTELLDFCIKNDIIRHRLVGRFKGSQEEKMIYFKNFLIFRKNKYL